MKTNHLLVSINALSPKAEDGPISIWMPESDFAEKYFLITTNNLLSSVNILFSYQKKIFLKFDRIIIKKLFNNKFILLFIYFKIKKLNINIY